MAWKQIVRRSILTLIVTLILTSISVPTVQAASHFVYNGNTSSGWAAWGCCFGYDSWGGWSGGFHWTTNSWPTTQAGAYWYSDGSLSGTCEIYTYVPYKTYNGKSRTTNAIYRVGGLSGPDGYPIINQNLYGSTVAFMLNPAGNNNCTSNTFVYLRDYTGNQTPDDEVIVFGETLYID